MKITNLSNNRIWSWHIHPIAKKIGNYIFFGGVSSLGDWYVSKYVTTTESLSHQKIYDGLEADDHNAVSLVINSGEDTVAFFQRHGKSGLLNWAKAAPGTLSFGSKSDTTFTGGVSYCQLMNDGSDVIYAFVRNTGKTWAFKKSTDYASTFGSETTLLDASGEIDNKLYIHLTPSEADPNIYNLVAFSHPNDGIFKKAVHAQIELDTGDINAHSGNIANLDGTNLPLKLADLDEVVSLSSDEYMRVLDAGDKYGTPLVYYAKWSDANPPQYFQAVKQTDGSWADTPLGIYPNHGFYYTISSKYLPGLALDRNGRNKIWVARQSQRTLDWKLEQYDINTSFELENPELVDTSILPLVRPVSVRDADAVIYQELQTYDNYMSYSSKVFLAEDV